MKCLNSVANPSRELEGINAGESLRSVVSSIAPTTVAVDMQICFAGPSYVFITGDDIRSVPPAQTFARIVFDAISPETLRRHVSCAPRLMLNDEPYTRSSSSFTSCLMDKPEAGTLPRLKRLPLYIARGKSVVASIV